MIEYLLEPLHDPISQTFAILIGILLFVGLYRAKARHGLSAFDRYSPTALTSIGVIGTFTGVYVGLMEFDVTDIEASVPILLSGLKIAFSTSILGMCASVLLKFFQSAVRPKSEKEDVSAIDIHRVMEEIREETRLARQSDEQLMEKIRKAIAGDGDSSLVTQIQKLRNATQDGYDDLKKASEQGFSALQAELHDFSEKVTDNSSKAFIEALQEVIGDFNTKINEQFGDNFKQLNEAVGSLLVWQETYKNQLKIMIDQFNEVVSGVTNVNSALNDIKLATDEIPASMDKLRTVLQTTNDQSEILKKQLEAFSEIREKAIDAFPLIEQNINQLTAGFTDSVTRSSKILEDSVQTQHTVMSEAVVSLKGSLQNSLSETNDVIQNSFTAFDQQMQSEVQRTIEVMGGHLASLSNKFVEDYQPLTEELKRIVRMAQTN